MAILDARHTQIKKPIIAATHLTHSVAFSGDLAPHNLKPRPYDCRAQILHLPSLPRLSPTARRPVPRWVPLIICSRCSQRMSPTKSGASSRKRSLPRLHNTWPFMPNLWKLTLTRLNSLVAQRSHWHTCCSVHSQGSAGEGSKDGTQGENGVTPGSTHKVQMCSRDWLEKQDTPGILRP